MGLDVTAYRNVKLIRATSDPTDDELDSENTVWLYQSADGLAEGVYSFESKYNFRAGSYSGYNEWRRWLASLVGTTPERVWKENLRVSFRGLINNFDCEGFIGPKTSAKLAADFERYMEVAKEKAADGWYFRAYADWMQAFKLASENGVVRLH